MAQTGFVRWSVALFAGSSPPGDGSSAYLLERNPRATFSRRSEIPKASVLAQLRRADSIRQMAAVAVRWAGTRSTLWSLCAGVM